MAKVTPCPRCGGRKRYTGYGFYPGVLSGYSQCGAKKCGRFIDVQPDLDGVPEDEHESAKKIAAKIMENEVRYDEQIRAAKSQGIRFDVTPAIPAEAQHLTEIAVKGDV